MEEQLKAENPGGLIRDLTIDGDDTLHYIVVYKDDKWTRKSRKLI